MGLIRDKYQKFYKALSELEDSLAIPIVHKRDVAGVIHIFKFTFEVTWKLLRELLVFKGSAASTSPRETFKSAYAAGLLKNEQIWLSMIKNRNLTSHTYDEKIATTVLNAIKKHYKDAFFDLNELVNKKYADEIS